MVAGPSVVVGLNAWALTMRGEAKRDAAVDADTGVVLDGPEVPMRSSPPSFPFNT